MNADSAQAYPLQWPLGRPRTKIRHAAAFGTYKRDPATNVMRRDKSAHSVGECVAEIRAELGRMGAREVVISSNIALRIDGLPRSGQPQPGDPGVAVYFRYEAGQRSADRHEQAPVCLACDRWHRVEDNLWAVFLTLEAMRGIDRWGAARLEATFTGYAALPAPAPSAPWSQVLGVDRFAPTDVVRAAFRELAKQHHPDAGGDPDRWHILSRAFEQFEQERGL